MRTGPTSTRFASWQLAGVSVLCLSPVMAAPPGTPITNEAPVTWVEGPGPGGSPRATLSNPVVTVVSGAAGLLAVKSADPAAIASPGGMITFRLMLQNPHPFDLSGVTISDTLDPLLDPPSSMASGAIPNLASAGGSILVTGVYVAATRTVQWDAGVVPAGARFEVGFSARISASAPEDVVLRNVSRQSSDQDPNGTLSNEVSVGIVSPALTISKEASRSRAEVGEPIGYTVTLANISPSLGLTAVVVTDRLPRGFAYREGSARLDRRRIPDPVPLGGDPRHLRFDLGDLPLGASVRLTYVAIPTPEADGRDGINRATAAALTPAGTAVSAGPAQASVRVAGSLLSGEAVVMGRVYVDDNLNGEFDDGEVGVPAARVYLEDGSFTFTDVVGKYHLEGVRTGLHVVKADPRTLPDGLRSFASWSRSAGGAGTQFVDLDGDQLFKSNLPTAGWGLSVSRLTARALYRDPNGRRGDGEGVDEEGLREALFPPLLAAAIFEPGAAGFLRHARSVVESYAALIRQRGGRLVSVEVIPSCYPLADEKLMMARASALQAEMSGLLLAAAPGGDDPQRIASSVPPRRSGPGEPDGGALPKPGVAPAGMTAQAAELESLERKVKEMTPDPELLSPTDREPVPGERTAVEVKLPSDLTPRLTVNGQVVPLDQIAVRMQTSLTRVAFYRYLGVPLQEGRNSIVLEGLDQWGNARAWVERIVSRIGRPGQIHLRASEGGLSADGRTPVQVIADVRDAQGFPVADGTLVSLESDAGEFLGADADPRQEGFQAATRAGLVTAHMSPATRAENRIVRARAGEASGQAGFSLEPERRDWIVAGVGEASVGHRGLSTGDPLTEALDGDAGMAGRMALYARGRLFGSSLMTLAYDSGRERDRDQLFRAHAPDRFFPIYGDSSSQGHEVEGQGKFSLRLDQPRSSFTLGDFATGLSGGDLLRYDRALTGGSGRLEMHGFSLQSFGATTPQTRVRDEMPGEGVSGPYRLTRAPLVINSERVVLETRDRFQPERVLASRELSRHADYDVDYEGGALLCKRPVPFQDDDFNSVVIVVTYETLDGDDRRVVAGGRAGYRFGQAVEIGTTYVHEDRATGDFVLRGADLALTRSFSSGPGGTIELRGEAAASESQGRPAGGAYAVRLAGRLGQAVDLTGHYRKVGEEFENPSRSGPVDVGTIRWGMEAAARLAAQNRLKAGFFTQEDPLRVQDRRVGSLDWERAGGQLTTRAGLKEVRALEPSTGLSASSRLVSAGATLKLGSKLEGLLSRQQVVQGAALRDYPTRTSLGLGLQVTPDVRGFLKQELDQSDEGRASRTVLGMESRLTRNTVMESRYSLEDALNGSRGLAQMGIRTKLPLNQDWLGDVSLERSAATRGASQGDFSALGVGFEYLPARVKFTTRYELRLGESDDTHVLTAGGATRLTDSLSLFTRQRLFLVNPQDSGARFDGDGLAGLAFRPVSDDRLNFLVKLQGLKGNGARTAGSAQARSYLGILEGNYQPIARLHLLGRLAFKDSRDVLEGESFASRSRLMEARGLVDVGQRFNVGATLRLLELTSAGSRVSGLGLESGWRLATDLWLVGGYNVTGFTESGFGDTERRDAGPFLSVRFKFDEESLAGITRGLADWKNRESLKRDPQAERVGDQPSE